MSVYREPSRRRMRLAAVAGLVGVLAGGIGGFALGRATEESPSLSERVAELQARARPALAALELVTIEYPEAVTDGRVVAETEYRAAAAQADAALGTVQELQPDLEALSPRDARRALRRVKEVAPLIERRAAEPRVAAAARRAARALERAVGAGRAEE